MDVTETPEAASLAEDESPPHPAVQVCVVVIRHSNEPHVSEPHFNVLTKVKRKLHFNECIRLPTYMVL